MRFLDVTAAAGLRNPLWGASAVFLVYDRDGWLDLFVVNYVAYDPSLPCRSASGRPEYCNPKGFAGTACKLFRNRGPQADPQSVAFEDVSVRARVGSVAGPGLGVIAADFDGDGWPDLFVANDGQPNRLWMNKRDGTAAAEASALSPPSPLLPPPPSSPPSSCGVGHTANGSRAFAGMGVALGDVDGDGLLDLFVTHPAVEQADEHRALKNRARAASSKTPPVESKLSGTRRRGTGFGAVLTDFDNDGRPDLVLPTGAIVYRC